MKPPKTEPEKSRFWVDWQTEVDLHNYYTVRIKFIQEYERKYGYRSYKFDRRNLGHEMRECKWLAECVCKRLGYSLEETLDTFFSLGAEDTNSHDIAAMRWSLPKVLRRLDRLGVETKRDFLKEVGLDGL